MNDTTSKSSDPTTLTPGKNGMEVWTDEPRFSSAALCVSLHLPEECCHSSSSSSSSSSSFRPEFTHQCVGPQECFEGYRPPANVLEQELTTSTSTSTTTSSTVRKHSSHSRHSQALYELQVRVDLAPSCQQCKVTILKSAIDNNKNNHHNHNNNNMEQAQQELLLPPISKKPKLVETVNDPWIPPQPWSEAKIRASVAKALPEIKDNNEDNDSSDHHHHDDDGYLLEPVGTVLGEYQMHHNNNTNNNNDTNTTTFVLSLADGNGGDGTTVANNNNNNKNYHSQVQRLALWFIENADDIDVSDDSTGGYWKVLYLFQKHSTTTTTTTNRYSLVGYTTLFHFLAPFHKPCPGVIVRICQALILPPYQGQGHGTKLLQCVYDYAHGKLQPVHPQPQPQQQQEEEHKSKSSSTPPPQPPPIVQVNVEDPAPGFVALRTKTDARFLLQQHPEWWPMSKSKSNNDNDNHNTVDDTIADPGFFTALSETVVSEMAAKSKLTTRQIQIVHELERFQRLSRYVTMQREQQQQQQQQRGGGGGGDALQGLKNNSDIENTAGNHQDSSTTNKDVSVDAFDQKHKADDKTHTQKEEEIEEYQKRFRLMVKKRLQKENREEMSSYRTKDDKKAFLARLFDDEHKLYRKLTGVGTT